MPARALFLVNRRSRSGASDIEAARQYLLDAGIALVEPESDSARGIAQAIRRHRAEVDLVIIGGGDGSMHAAAPALVETGLPLALLPLGTANDLARTLSIPADPVAAAAVIVDGVRHRIDLGRVNGHYFFNVAHIGFGVQITRALSPESKRRWGALAYVAALARTLRSVRAFRADIVCDGVHRRIRTIQLAIGNGRHFGGGTTVAAPARIDDGCFFTCSVQPLSWREMVSALLRLPALRAGKFETHDPVEVMRGRHIEVHTQTPMAISADGEIVARTPARFDLEPAALEVLVPPAYFEDRKEICHAAQG